MESNDYSPINIDALPSDDDILNEKLIKHFQSVDSNNHIKIPKSLINPIMEAYNMNFVDTVDVDEANEDKKYAASVAKRNFENNFNSPFPNSCSNDTVPPYINSPTAPLPLFDKFDKFEYESESGSDIEDISTDETESDRKKREELMLYFGTATNDIYNQSQTNEFPENYPDGSFQDMLLDPQFLSRLAAWSASNVGDGEEEQDGAFIEEEVSETNESTTHSAGAEDVDPIEEMMRLMAQRAQFGDCISFYFYY